MTEAGNHTRNPFNNCDDVVELVRAARAYITALDAGSPSTDARKSEYVERRRFTRAETLLTDELEIKPGREWLKPPPQLRGREVTYHYSTHDFFQAFHTLLHTPLGGNPLEIPEGTAGGWIKLFFPIHAGPLSEDPGSAEARLESVLTDCILMMDPEILMRIAQAKAHREEATRAPR